MLNVRPRARPGRREGEREWFLPPHVEGVGGSWLGENLSNIESNRVGICLGPLGVTG